MNQVTSAVETAVKAGTAFKKLKSIKWRLATAAGQYVQKFEVAIERPTLGGEENAIVFDGRNNEAMKAAYYSAVLKVDLQPELISCAC